MEDNAQPIAAKKTSAIRVKGESFTQLPEDLYIPPDALEVFLETFEGPLDLLLYLIRKQNLDILDIPVAEITRQYMKYIELMQELRLELAAEYLVMAAMLMEIKSRMLLPKPVNDEGEEEDPRAELIRRLQEYERFKEAAEKLDQLPRYGRDFFPAKAYVEAIESEQPIPPLDLRDLMFAFQEVLQRASLSAHHHVQRETLSVRERMSNILEKLKSDSFMPFTSFFNTAEGRIGVVVTFIAILELFRNSMIELIQSEPFSPIHIRATVL